MKKFYGVMSLLIILFTAPGILAYVVYHHPNWISGRTNHGHLLQPPTLLHSTYQGNKWQLLYWSPKSCDQACMQRMGDLAKLRLALGRRLYYVDLVLATQSAQPQPDVLQELQKIDGQMVQTQESLGEQSAIYLVNPQHYVILAYSSAQASKEIFQDLQKMVHDK
ncbi:MAG: hypothetical protein ACO1N3_04935 [Gammaproteobacteria bacterium]